MFSKTIYLALISWFVFFEDRVKTVDAMDVLPPNILSLLASLKSESEPEPDPCVDTTGRDISIDELDMQGNTYLIEKEYEKALNCYEKAVAKIITEDLKIPAIREKASKIFRRRALCQEGLKNWIAAEEDHQEAVALNPGDFIARSLLASASMRVKKYDSVIKNCERGIDIIGRVPAMQSFAQLFREKLAQACLLKTGFQPCVEDEVIKPGTAAVFPAKVLVTLGDQFYEDGQHEEAAQCFGKAIEKDGDVAEYYKKRGHCYMKLRQWEAARNDFQKVVKLEPNNVQFRIHLGYASLFSKCYEEVIHNLVEAKTFLNEVDDSSERHRFEEKIDELLYKARYPNEDSGP